MQCLMIFISLCCLAVKVPCPTCESSCVHVVFCSIYIHAWLLGKGLCLHKRHFPVWIYIMNINSMSCWINVIFFDLFVVISLLIHSQALYCLFVFLYYLQLLGIQEFICMQHHFERHLQNHSLNRGESWFVFNYMRTHLIFPWHSFEYQARFWHIIVQLVAANSGVLLSFFFKFRWNSMKDPSSMSSF